MLRGHGGQSVSRPAAITGGHLSKPLAHLLRGDRLVMKFAPTEQDQPMAPSKLIKGQYVKGRVTLVDAEQASISVDAGGDGTILAQLSWKNFTKAKAQMPPTPALLEVGETIWACVLSEGQVPQLSTAALEARPGSMLTNKTRLFSALDQWASTTLPEDGKKASFQEWRGQRELKAFLANGRKQSKGARDSSTRPLLNKQLLPQDVASKAPGLADWNPESNLSLGDIVLGNVTSIQPYGIFVKVPGLIHDAFIPISQVSKSRVHHEELRNGTPPPLAKGDELIALVIAVEEDRPSKSSKSDEGSSPDDDQPSMNEETENEDINADKTDPQEKKGMRFVLSTRVLEGDEEGIMKRGLKEYNPQALEVHRKYALELSSRNLEASLESLALFREDVNRWKESSFAVPRGSIVKGVVTAIQDFGVFVKLDQGPSALLHKDSVTEAHVLPKGGVFASFKVGDVVFGYVYNHPVHTPSDLTKGKVLESKPGYTSPSSFWLSTKKFEKKESVGRVLKDPQGFWKAARSEYTAQQSLRLSKQQGSEIPTMTMRAFDLDVRNLRGAIKSVQYVPWEGLLGCSPLIHRWPPGLSSIVWSDEARGGSKSSKASSSVAKQYQQLCPELSGQVAEKYYQVITEIQDQMEGLVAKSLEPLVGFKAEENLADAETPSSRGSSPAAVPDWLQEMDEAQGLRPEMRHAWASAREPTRKAIERISLLRLKSCLVRHLRESSMELDPQALMKSRSQVEEAAVNVVCIAELILVNSSVEAAGALLSEFFPLLRMFPAPESHAGSERRQSCSIPGVVAERLVLLGWTLISSGGAWGGARGLQTSLIVEMFALASYHPPPEWSGAAFKLLYKTMVVNADATESIRFFRLMRALGYQPPGYSWWDRVLQQVYFCQSHEQTRPFVMDEMREAIQALVV